MAVTTLTLGKALNAGLRRVLEDDTDYSSSSEESDTPPTDRPLRRKNGHDDRCLTIHVSTDVVVHLPASS